VQIPQFLQGVIASLRTLPRTAYFIAVPVAIFATTVAVTLATSGGDDGPKLAVNPTAAVPSTQNIDEPATPTATVTKAPSTPTPTPVPVANREDCTEIQGTAYESPEERTWYLANCLNGQTATTNNSGGSAPPSGGTTSGPPAVGAGEFVLGDRMLIPSIGADASVNGVQVPSSGAMPDPVGYFNFVWYDFSYFGGLGGYAGSGNHVVGCHVDSAIYGAVLCWHVRSLSAGAQIQYIKSNGEVINYTVVSSTTYSASADFTSIVAAGTADLTIITCTGTFAGGSYDQRHVVQAVRS
jgi:hypothetical protein